MREIKWLIDINTDTLYCGIEIYRHNVAYYLRHIEQVCVSESQFTARILLMTVQKFIWHVCVIYTRILYFHVIC
jgi:hypothetical protein